MLPGFRFLFAAIMLSMSLLVFGLGAAALLRAAHESFASNSSWRAAPEVSFAQRAEPTLPMLATLRIDTPVVEKIPEQAPPTASSADTSPPTSAPATSEQLAALRPVDAAPAETMTSELAPPAVVLAEDLPPATTPPAAEAAATGDQSTIAAVTMPGAASSGVSEPASAPPEPTSAPPATPVADQASIAITRIATLGGPPVDVIEDTIKDTPPARARTAKPDPAKTDQSAIKRRVEAKRVVHRRRLSARARLALQAAQQQTNPFAPPPSPATPATRQRQ
jgi:hypothetical protein